MPSSSLRPNRAGAPAPTGAQAAGRAGAIATVLAAVLAAVLASATWLITAATALADTPVPTQAAVGDPRSSGQGPGLVGDPLIAIAIVVVIALVSLGATLLYVRATGGRRNA